MIRDWWPIRPPVSIREPFADKLPIRTAPASPPRAGPYTRAPLSPPAGVAVRYRLRGGRAGPSPRKAYA